MPVFFSISAVPLQMTASSRVLHLGGSAPLSDFQQCLKQCQEKRECKLPLGGGGGGGLQDIQEWLNQLEAQQTNRTKVAITAPTAIPTHVRLKMVSQTALEKHRGSSLQ